VAILSAPSCGTIPKGPQSGWALRGSQGGCVQYTRIHWSKSSNAGQGWTFPTDILGGMDLFNFNKGLFGATAKYWKSGVPASLGYTDDNGTAFPFTNLDGSKTTHTGFELWMHNQKPAQFNGGYFGDPWVPGYVRTSPQAFQTSITEDDMPAAIITAAEFHQDGTYSIAVSNWGAFSSDVGFACIYVSLPTNKNPLRRKLIMVDCTGPNPDPSPWTDQGRGTVRKLIRPYPIGANMLLGIRGIYGQPDNGVLPTPIAIVPVQVLP
jgi:hypothetical protein